MAALTNTTVTNGVFTPTTNTLTSSDTLTYDSGKKQLLVLRNTTGSSVNVTIDGNGGTTVAVDGIGSVDVSAGLVVAVPANATRAVLLPSIRHYLQGTVAVTGGVGVVADIYNL